MVAVNELVEILARGITDPVFVKDLGGRYVFANEAAARQFGRNRADIEGRTDAELLPDEQAVLLAAHDRQVIEGGVAMAFEETLVSPDGQRTFLTTKAPQRDSCGKIVGVIGVGQDITLRVVAERRARQLQDLAGRLAAALTLDDVAKAVLDVSMSATDAAGAGIAIRDESDGLRILDTRNLPSALATVGERVALDSPLLLAHVVRTAEPISLDDRSSAPPALVAAMSAMGVHSGIWVPIPVAGTVVGAIGHLFTTSLDEAAEHRELLEAIALRAGQALERARLYAAERTARVHAQEQAADLAELQRVTTALARAVDSADVARTTLIALRWRLGLLGSLLATVDENGGLQVLDQREVGTVEAGAVIALPPRSLLDAVDPLVLDGAWGEPADLPGVGAVFAAAGYRWVTPLPLRGRQRLVGMLVLGWKDEPSLADATRHFIATLTTLCGQALERASLFDSEHAIAEAVQRSLLPRLPESVGRVRLVGRFKPGGRNVLVGGDWFDAFDLVDDQVALCVGDVEGHGINAATCMAVLRAALHALATSSNDPATIVSRLRWSPDLAAGPMVTLALGVLDGHEFRYVQVGHPPILLRHDDGEIEVLNEGRSVPMGLGLAAEDKLGVVAVRPGTTIVMYTDGLIERRGEALDVGLARLVDAVAVGPEDLDALADWLLERCSPADGDDDIALLVARARGDVRESDGPR